MKVVGSLMISCLKKKIPYSPWICMRWFTDSTYGKNHHHLPPFGRICLDFFSFCIFCMRNPSIWTVFLIGGGMKSQLNPPEFSSLFFALPSKFTKKNKNIHKFCLKNFVFSPAILKLEVALIFWCYFVVLPTWTSSHPSWRIAPWIHPRRCNSLPTSTLPCSLVCMDTADV